MKLKNIFKFFYLIFIFLNFSFLYSNEDNSKITLTKISYIIRPYNDKIKYRPKSDTIEKYVNIQLPMTFESRKDLDDFILKTLNVLENTDALGKIEFKILDIDKNNNASAIMTIKGKIPAIFYAYPIYTGGDDFTLAANFNWYNIFGSLANFKQHSEMSARKSYIYPTKSFDVTDWSTSFNIKNIRFWGLSWEVNYFYKFITTVNKDEKNNILLELNYHKSNFNIGALKDFGYFKLYSSVGFDSIFFPNFYIDKLSAKDNILKKNGFTLKDGHQYVSPNIDFKLGFGEIKKDTNKLRDGYYNIIELKNKFPVYHKIKYALDITLTSQYYYNFKFGEFNTGFMGFYYFNDINYDTGKYIWGVKDGDIWGNLGLVNNFSVKFQLVNLNVFKFKIGITNDLGIIGNIDKNSNTFNVLTSFEADKPFEFKAATSIFLQFNIDYIININFNIGFGMDWTKVKWNELGHGKNKFSNLGLSPNDRNSPYEFIVGLNEPYDFMINFAFTFN